MDLSDADWDAIREAADDLHPDDAPGVMVIVLTDRLDAGDGVLTSKDFVQFCTWMLTAQPFKNGPVDQALGRLVLFAQDMDEMGIPATFEVSLRDPIQMEG